MNRTSRLLSFSALLLTASLSLAQTATSSLRGTVTDPVGAVVAGATVTLESKETGFHQTHKTEKDGGYQFQQVPPATYAVTVESPGFATETSVVQLLVAQPATLNVPLHVSSSETVEVESNSVEVLNTTNAAVGNAVEQQTVEALPMEGRNVPDLLSLQPGVLYLGQQTSTQQNTDSRSGSVAGARSDQTNVTLDGLDDNDQQNGYAFTGVLRSTLDSTEEFRVTTTSSNADAGRSSGAQVTLVTKSGTNRFHGAAYEYNRNNVGYANDWFNKQSELSSDLPNKPGELIRNTFGGSFGGPIWKDKLFFFFNYEGQRTRENQQVSQTVPSAAYRQGFITYQYCVNPNDPTCAQTSTNTLSPGQITTLDQPCLGNGVCTVPGPNPAVLAVFQSYPMPNNTGVGDGYNSVGYSFSSPYPGSLNTTILKLDYAINDKHHLFVRGNLQKDTQSGTQNFPGQPAQSNLVDNTKGIAAGETWSVNSHIVNDVRYGYIRQGYGNSGIGVGDYTVFRFLTQPVAETRSTIVWRPVNNIVDNLSWTKGNHTIGVGGNWRLIHNNSATDANSYNEATTNPYWLVASATPEPTGLTPAQPAVSGGFSDSYLVAYANLVGAVPQLNNVYNYSVSKDATTGNALADGADITRKFKANEYEWYIQDAWRLMPNLTVTYGIRHTILQTPYEVNGQQIAPTIDTDAWYKQRGSAAAQGQVYEPDLEFYPNGPAHHAPGFWSKQKTNFAPRFAIAYSPDAKTSIRGGFGLYFDHYGEGIVNTFSQNGSFGLSTQLSNPANVYTSENAPRFTSIHTQPNIPLGVTPPTVTTYPYTPPDGAFLITWGADNKLKTPYAEAMDFSVQRELRGGLTLEVAYVGRLGRHLLQAIDLAEPVNYVDPQGGGDYFTNATKLSKMVDANGGNANATVPAIPYFEDVFPQLSNYGGDGMSATQNIYSLEWAPNRYGAGETTALADLDFSCNYGCPQGTKFWQSQFSSLYAWDSIGMSSYNALQLTVRHPVSHGLQFDFSYTLSKSIDMGSDTERASEITGNGSFSSILNTWNPSLNRGVSDFDTRHLITYDWVYQLPFGQGKRFANSANWVVNELVGGWQWSGLSRWTSGLPFSLFAPGWATDWQLESFGVKTAPVKIRKHLDQNGNPEVFDNPSAINNGVEGGGSPVRLPYPGEAGERNAFRGDGFFDIDSGLAKTFKITEGQGLKFAWEVFNVTNSVRFDVNTNAGNLGAGLLSGNLGNYAATLSKPRVMQFSLRYDF